MLLSWWLYYGGRPDFFSFPILGAIAGAGRAFSARAKVAGWGSKGACMSPSFRAGAREGFRVCLPVSVGLIPWALVTGLAMVGA